MQKLSTTLAKVRLVGTPDSIRRAEAAFKAVGGIKLSGRELEAIWVFADLIEDGVSPNVIEARRALDDFEHQAQDDLRPVLPF